MPNGQSISPVLTNDASVQDMGPGAITNQLPSLKESADIQRATITSFNEYKNVPNQGYSDTHPNSQSDGDDEGRGEAGFGTVGNSDDIATKNLLVYSSGNKWKPGSGYYNQDFPEQYW